MQAGHLQSLHERGGAARAADRTHVTSTAVTSRPRWGLPRMGPSSSSGGDPAGESSVRARLVAGDVRAAVEAALALYGAEVFGFFVGVLADDELARIVYADFVRQTSGELAAFRWRCTLRVWLYAVARRELRERLFVNSAGARATVAEGVHTSPLRPVGMTAAIDEIRASLTEQERELLILSVDRGFGWYELAATELGEPGAPGLLEETARLIKARAEALIERIERQAALRVRSR